MLRAFGYAWSFGTIWPAIFEGAELVGMWRGSTRGARTHRPMTDANVDRSAFDRRIIVREPVGVWSWLSIVAGAALLAWPVLRPSPYLAAPVWLGFVFLLDPVNAYLQDESLFADVRARRYDRLINLVSSGFLCGILWEFWNYWARAKWHYTVPIMENLKIFEMPLPGYLGFPAFALECFTMYVFLRHVCFGLGPDLIATERARTIAL
jgi:hypothetical protein